MVVIIADERKYLDVGEAIAGGFFDMAIGRIGVTRIRGSEVGALGWVLISIQALSGCGYSTDRDAHFRTTNAKNDRIQSVAVDIFGSREFRRDLELQLTEAVAKRIEIETPFKLAKKQQADTLLTGEVKEVRQGTLGRDFQEVRPRETAATLVVSFQWKDLRTGEVLVDRPRFVQTVDYIRPVGEDFYHAMQRACDRMAERIVEELESDNW